MNVNITFSVARYTSKDKIEMQLSEGACFKDLLAEIGRRYGTKMPQPIWDASRMRFTHHVLAMRGFKHLTDLSEPLNAGDNITFFLIMAGG